MDKMIVTSLLIVAGVISAITVFNAIYPLIGQSNATMTSMQTRMDERFKTQIQIVHAAKTPSDEVHLWVKNIGTARVLAIESSDVFFGPQSNFARIPYNTGSGTYWQYSIEGGGTDWNPVTTVKFVIKGYTFLGPGTRYFVKVVLTNGVNSEYYFSE
ncbi:MAG: hypothetical protein HY868_11335 [Chloroflexi bacterium]|nr:hypothetical protein [Chloroflexota bacterium]